MIVEPEQLEEAQGRLHLARRREEHFYLAWLALKRELTDPRHVNDALNRYRRAKIERVYWARRVRELMGSTRDAGGPQPGARTAPGARPPIAAAVGAARAAHPTGRSVAEERSRLATDQRGDTQSAPSSGGRAG
jgi:hypothetical protein